MIFKTKNFQISYLSFSFIFPALTYIVSNVFNIHRIAAWFDVNGATNYLGLVIFLFIGLLLYIAIFVLLASRHSIKPVSIILLVLNGCFAYFIGRYGLAIDRVVILNIVNTDPTEATGFVSIRMLPYIVFMMIVPAILILKTKIQSQGFLKTLATRGAVFLGSLVLAVGLLYLNFNSISRVVNSSNRYVIQTLLPINYIQSFGSIIQNSAQAFYKRNHKIEFDGQVVTPGNLVVVVAIGETSRQKNFSLYGYKRKDTNPMLSKEKDLHVLNGIARVGSTLYALPEILAKDGVPLPLATSKVGIETSCYVNYTMYEACDSVGEVEVSKCGHDGKCYDEDVVPLLSSNLKTYSSGYRMVLLHLGGGSHGPSYHLRHPPEFQQFKPLCLDPDVLNNCSEDQLYNSFDNTILYADFVVSKIIAELEQSKVPYVFIYLSDHGESLGEEGRVFHGMPLGIKLPPEQAHIPLMVKSSVPIVIEKREEYPQTDVFDTISSLFTIDSKLVDKKASFIKRVPR